MRVPGDTTDESDTRPATYAGAITILCILALIAIRTGVVKGGK